MIIIGTIATIFLSAILTVLLLLLKELRKSNRLVSSCRFVKPNVAAEPYKGELLDAVVPGLDMTRKPGIEPTKIISYTGIRKA